MNKESIKVIEDVNVILEIIESENKKFIENTSNTREVLLNKLDSILNYVHDLKIQIQNQDKTSHETDDSKPTLWIYGCSMSHKHDFSDHSKSWYTLLSNKIDYNLKIRSGMGLGINEIQRRFLDDAHLIKPYKDLVIFSPSFFHRVYIREFQEEYRSFLPNSREWDWYKYMDDLDEVISDNFQRWIGTCELMMRMNINFRTWLLDPPLSDEYPYQNSQRIAKFHHLILKPPITPQVLGWMPFQKENPDFWYDNKKGKEDYHWNESGHEFVCNQFYQQIFGKNND